MTPNETADILDRIRARSPLVHHITNWVTIYECAAVVKAVGGSPVMAHAAGEAAEMTGLADALVLNIGTLTPSIVESMRLAGAAANAKGIPVVLDACGAGATALRDRACAELLETVRMAVVKGNASEIARVAGEDVRTRGVDASDAPGDAAAAAVRLAAATGAVAVVTGAVDTVTDGARTWRVANGHPLMAAVVGTGCMAASLIGTFCAVEPDPVKAAAAALVCFGTAAEIAAARAEGPASFKTALIDAVHRLDRTAVRAGQKLDAGGGSSAR